MLPRRTPAPPQLQALRSLTCYGLLSARLLACVLLFTRATDAEASCPAGLYNNNGACELCATDTYMPTEGAQAACLPCPEQSYAHFAGSTGCLACYFGEPKVVAGELDGQGGMWPGSMPAEQPKLGYRVAKLAAGLGSCSASPFSACSSSTAGSTVAIKTDDACLVQVYVLGDAACSKAGAVVMVSGAYATTKQIRSLPEDIAVDGGGGGVSLLITQTGSNLNLSFAAGATTCGSTATLADPAAACPNGTAVDSNPEASDTAVFRDTQCAPCATGFSCPAGAPQACAPGTYNQLLGAAACPACPDGTTSPAGSDICLECEAGTTPSAAKDTCDLCPAGHYSKLPGEPCAACPAGTYRGAYNEGTSCTSCPPGAWSAPGADECTSCGPGTAAEEQGTTPDAATGGCPACPAGSYAEGDGSYSCNPCPVGSYSAAARSPACTPCAAGTVTSTATGQGATACIACPGGTYRSADTDDNKCRMCPSGFETRVSGGGATDCTACLPGYVAASPRTPFCAACPPGTFASAAASKQCRACAAGFVTGLSPTNAQAAGSGGSGNVSRTGAAAVAATRCDACPRRTFRPSQYSSNQCTPCPKGRETMQASGATVCTTCIPGTKLGQSGGVYDTSCTACGPGEYAQNQGTFDACTPCPTGHFVVDGGNSVCDACDPGTYQNRTGATGCTDCPPGTYNDRLGAAWLGACRLAPRGSFAAGSGNDGFSSCEAGSYQDQEGQASCKPCPPGCECPTGAAYPRECMPGFAADMKQPYCRQCEKGSYQDEGRQRACKPCPAAAFCPSSKLSLYERCPAGTYGTQYQRVTKSEACIPCPINTITALPGLMRCTKCGSGQWTGKLTGKNQCWPTNLKLPRKKS